MVQPPTVTLTGGSLKRPCEVVDARVRNLVPGSLAVEHSPLLIEAEEELDGVDADENVGDAIDEPSSDGVPVEAKDALRDGLSSHWKDASLDHPYCLRPACKDGNLANANGRLGCIGRLDRVE